MKLIINPCKCDVGTGKMYNAFVEISYKDGKLSLHGVIGPRRNGNCYGSCGQCVDEIREGTPNPGWSREMLDKLCDIWDAWHLNDLRPYCEHQKALGWDKEAVEAITIHRYSLTSEAYKRQKDAKSAAITALKNGETFTPTASQVYYATLPYFLDVYGDKKLNVSSDYRPSDLTGCSSETKTRGWMRFDQSELGLIGKPCPVCGYKYGTAWKKEEVPKEIIDWLFALPETTIEPAWI